MATIHALGLQITQQWREQLGYGPGPLVVYDEVDASALLWETARGLGLDAASFSKEALAEQVDHVRLADLAGVAPESVRLLAHTYEALLFQRGAVDYTGMLTLPLRLFREHPHALRLCQDAYRHVLVDEGQDVSAPQYALVRLLAARHRNLVIVGDARQTLYAWRGADGCAMRDLPHDFPATRTIHLGENFRSTGHIVAVANALGAAIDPHLLWTANPAGHRALLAVVQDEQREAAFVADEVIRLHAHHDLTRLDEAAILVRIHAQLQPFITALRERRLPYHVRGGGDLFAKAVVRDVLAYLRLAVNPDDAAALGRIVNTPPRHLTRLAQRLKTTPTPLRMLPRLASSDGADAVRGAWALAALVEDLRAEYRRRSPAALLDLALERSGYLVWLAGQRDGPDRIGQVQRLRSLLASLRLGELAAWLSDVQLDGVSGAGPDSSGDGVVVSTIHQAKGSQWRIVFLPGMEEGLLPHARTLAEATGRDAAVEGERRVAFVAVTRPRERLYLTRCRTRRIGDRQEPRTPSRFLTGMPLEIVERATETHTRKET